MERIHGGPILKYCIMWEGPALEQFMRDCISWEGPHTRVEEQCEEEGVAETKYFIT